MRFAPSLSAALLICLLVSCGSQEEPTTPTPPEAEATEATTAAPAATPANPQPNPDFPFSTTRPTIAIETNYGRIEAELYADQAPETVATFIKLAEGAMLSKRGGEEANHNFYDGLTFHRVIPNFMIQGGCPQGTGSGGPGFSYGDEINADSLGLNDERVIQNADNLLKLMAGTEPVGPREQQMLMQTSVHEQVSYQLQQIAQQVIAPRARTAGLDPNSTPEEMRDVLKTVLDGLKEYSLKDFYEQQGYQYRDDLPASSKPMRGSLALANSGPATNGSQFFINVADTPHLTGKHTVFGHVTKGLEEVVDAISIAPADPQSNRPLKPIVIKSIRLIEPATVEALFQAP